jgi:hypothetical protein
MVMEPQIEEFIQDVASQICGALQGDLPWQHENVVAHVKKFLSKTAIPSSDDEDQLRETLTTLVTGLHPFDFGDTRNTEYWSDVMNGTTSQKKI